MTEALKHLSSIDLAELCKEAKIEKCRASTGLHSCGNYVRHVLVSCGHPSLCEECSHSNDICPICKTQIPRSGSKLRLRLFDECVEAGFVSQESDDRLKGTEDGNEYLMDDVRRLYLLFDVSLRNNLVSLICQYVMDVCMDESAVSSDPITAFLLDEVVVKDWCERTFIAIVHELQKIYNYETGKMKTNLDLLFGFSIQLTGLGTVLDVLESSLNDGFSTQIQDLHYLQERVLKAKQHLETMMWCIKHDFLGNIHPCHGNFSAWRDTVHARKVAATKRSWPNTVDSSMDSIPKGLLFIEDTLSNLKIEQGSEEMSNDRYLSLLQKDSGYGSFSSKIEYSMNCYPFESMRVATDILFLWGSCDMVLAKQATFLYHLFDRHWRLPCNGWRKIVDDFAATFSIARQSILESFCFYLLDDHTDEAFKEASHILPEISCLTTHPKVAQVLLERQNPDVGLMVLRWSGSDSSIALSLTEAITAIRVRVECGLLTEAFMYQRRICMKMKELKLQYPTGESVFAQPKGAHVTCEKWVETLVTEICCLCLRRNLVDRMLELPWNSDEEKYLNRFLLEHAVDDPQATSGSLLVAFYLQRFRHSEAYQVHCKIDISEQDFLSKDSVSEAEKYSVQSASRLRTVLIDKAIGILAEVQQQAIRSGTDASRITGSVSNGHIEPVANGAAHSLSVLCDKLFTSPEHEDSISNSDGTSIVQNRHLASPSIWSGKDNNIALRGLRRRTWRDNQPIHVIPDVEPASPFCGSVDRLVGVHEDVMDSATKSFSSRGRT